MRKVFNVNQLDVKSEAAAFNKIRAEIVNVDGLLRVPETGTFVGPTVPTIISDLNVDNITPSTGNLAISGGNLCLSLGNSLTVDEIDSYNGMYVCMPGGLNVDTINSKTVNGTVVDGALIKNGTFYSSLVNPVETLNHKNMPLGYLGLDETGKISMSNFSSNILVLVGYWSPAVPGGGTPNLNNPTYKVNGNVYIVSANGTNDIGNGPQGFVAGDTLVYVSASMRWLQFAADNHVTSVNGQTGNVLLTTDNIPQNTNLYYSNEYVSADANVTAATSHRMITSGNPHNNTPADVGNTTAQWNANKLQGVSVASTAPTTGDAMGFNGTMWGPTAISGGGGTGAILMLAAFKTLGSTVSFNSGGLFTFTVWDGPAGVMINNVSFSAGTFTFPSSGKYRIQWGASYVYYFGASVTADARITITNGGEPIPTQTAPVCSTFSDRKTCSGSWTGTVVTPATGIMQCFQSSGGPIGNYVDSYWIIIEKWL